MDYRDRIATFGNGRDKRTLDVCRMLLTLTVAFEDEEGFDCEEEITVPAVYEVCPSCNGKGSYVNPSIDAHGISAEEMDEDPDFREDYFRGAYDVTCGDCIGHRVVAEIDRDRCDAATLARIDASEERRADSIRERAAEMRMGY